MPSDISDDDGGDLSPISPVVSPVDYPSSPPIRRNNNNASASASSAPVKPTILIDGEDQLSLNDISDDDDNDDTNDVMDHSNLSLPIDQQKELAQVESSFRGSTPDPFLRADPDDDDADLSIVVPTLISPQPQIDNDKIKKDKRPSRDKEDRRKEDKREKRESLPGLPADDSFNKSDLESFSSPSTLAKARAISSQYTPKQAPRKSALRNEVPSQSEASEGRRRLRTQRSRSSISSIGSEKISDIEAETPKPVSRKESRRSRDRTSRDDFDFGFSDKHTRLSSDRQSLRRNPSGASSVGMTAAVEKVLEDLDEEGRSDSAHSDMDHSDMEPETPRPARPVSDPIPPETQLKAQIRNIKVPDTIARDFRKRESSNGSFTPSKKPGTAGRGMTLKEQSGTIDKLQKENWDLRIKVFHLNNRLDKTSEESVKILTNENGILAVENTQLKSHVKTLKKRIKQLEKAGDASSTRNGSDDAEDKPDYSTLETEVIYWKEQTEKVEVEVETLRSKVKEKEGQCERLSEIVRGMAGGGEEVETLRDFLESEAARRKQAEEDNAALRRELWDLKAAQQGTQPEPNPRSRSAVSVATDNNIISQLRTENEDLRREVSAQLSMLTSRNREKERLYQEIEELKLGLPRDNSQLVQVDNYDRAMSRVSSNPQAQMADAEREDYENANGALRDKISEHKLKIQDLEIELETKLREFDKVIIQRQEFGDLAAEYEEELEVLNADLQVVIAERNEQARLREELEQDFDNLKDEAEEEIQRLEEEIDIRAAEMEKLEEELRNKDENFGALQEEMRTLSTVVVRMEDAQAAGQSRIQELEAELTKSQRVINENEAEMTTLEKQLHELTTKSERLGVQQESAQGEIAFLREEQDSDKIKIGQLESAMKSLEEGLKDEKERSRSLSDRLLEERKLMDETRNMNKAEMEKLVNDKNQEILNMKEAARQLKKNLARREAEVKDWKEKLAQMEDSIRESIGELAGSKVDVLKAVVHLHQELEKRMEELGRVKTELAEKDRTLKDRENLMENTALEVRRLNELLEKERQGRKADKAAAENLQASHEKSRRLVSQHQSQLAELEKSRSKDSKALSQLEIQYKEQLAERNSLLVQLWIRLSAICGAEWADKNKLVGKGGAVLSADASVNNHLTGFSKSVLAAAKNLETVLTGFKTRIRNIERDLWKEYAVVENTLETRTRRLERLEAMVRDGVGEQSSMRNEITKLKTENRLLKAELNVVRLQPSKLPVRSGISSAASRDSLTAADNSIVQRGSPDPPGDTSLALNNTIASLDDVTDENERRWILRLRELEKRLKAEREARLLDRTGAKARLEEARSEREALKKELERERTIARLDRDDEDDKKHHRMSMIPKPKGSGSGGGKSRDIDDNGGNGLLAPPDDEDVRSLIVRVERERRGEHRAKSRDRSDRHKSRERRSASHRDTPDELSPSSSGQHRDRSRNRESSSRADSRVRDRGERVKERSVSERTSSTRGPGGLKKPGSEASASKMVTIISSIDELNARMERGKSPAKKENTLSPRKFLGGFFGSKGKDE